MSALSNSRLIWAYYLDPNQSDIVPLVVIEIIPSFIFRSGRQLVVIHLSLVQPMHAKYVRLPHTSTTPNS